MRRAAAIVEAARVAVESVAPLVVLSAMGKTTDALFAAARAAAGGDLATALGGRDELRRRHLAAAEDLFGGEPPAALVAALDGELARLSELLNGVAMLRELTPRTMDAIAATGELLSTRLFAAFVGGEWFDVRAVMRTDRHPAPRGPTPRAGALVAEGLARARRRPRGRHPGLRRCRGRRRLDDHSPWRQRPLRRFGGARRCEVQIWTDVEG
jgi:aspartokinase